MKVAPMDFKAIISENGRQVNGEARVNVLTSQLEDMLFRIRIRADNRKKYASLALMQSHHSALSSAMPPLIMYSAPIKVVSKPDQVQKRRKKREEEAKRKAASVALATGLVSPAAASLSAVPLFGHPVTDEMVKALQNVERQQHAQQELLNRVIEQLGGRPPNIVLTQSELLALESLGIEPLEMGDPQEPVSWDNNSGSDSEDATSSEQRKSPPRLSLVSACAC